MCTKVRLCMFSLSNTNLALLKWSSALHVSYFTPLWIFWRRVMDSITIGILPLIKYRAKKLENDEIVTTTASTIEILPCGLHMSANMVCLLYSTTRRRMRLIQRFIRHSSLPQPEPSMGTCNVLGKRAGQASEPVKISPTLPSTINYRSDIGDIETKQLVLQTTELNSMSNFTTLATLW
jgi:hypothetical protein